MCTEAAGGYFRCLTLHASPFLECLLLPAGWTRNMPCSPTSQLNFWVEFCGGLAFWVVRLAAFRGLPVGGYRASADHPWSSFRFVRFKTCGTKWLVI
eukprot:365711-Chlamydomonas_euryale.AAC.7